MPAAPSPTTLEESRRLGPAAAGFPQLAFILFGHDRKFSGTESLARRDDHTNLYCPGIATGGIGQGPNLYSLGPSLVFDLIASSQVMAWPL